MIAKHTPGPWLIRKGDEWTKDVVTLDGHASQGEPMYWNLASCNKQRDECDANLLLIAAAPELLNALQNLLLATENLGYAEGGLDGLHELYVAANAAQLIRDKATGEAK